MKLNEVPLRIPLPDGGEKAGVMLEVTRLVRQLLKVRWPVIVLNPIAVMDDLTRSPGIVGVGFIPCGMRAEDVALSGNLRPLVPFIGWNPDDDITIFALPDSTPPIVSLRPSRGFIIWAGARAKFAQRFANLGPHLWALSGVLIAALTEGHLFLRLGRVLAGRLIPTETRAKAPHSITPPNLKAGLTPFASKHGLHNTMIPVVGR